MARPGGFIRLQTHDRGAGGLQRASRCVRVGGSHAARVRYNVASVARAFIYKVAGGAWGLAMFFAFFILF